MCVLLLLCRYINNYALLRHVGKGSTGTVKLGLSLNRASLEAVKIVSMDNYRVRRESVHEYVISTHRPDSHILSLSLSLSFCLRSEKTRRLSADATK